MSDVLARGVIEIGIDEIKLQDEIQSARSTLSKEFNASLQRTKLDRSEREKLAKVTKDLAYTDMSRVKMMGQVARVAKTVSQVTRSEAKDRERLYKVTGDLMHLDMGRVKLADQSEKSMRRQLSFAQSSPAARALLSKGAGFNQDKWHTMAADGPLNISQGLGRFASGVGASGAAAAGLTYAGAAMAGSTTMDTLTGSLKMLSLAAGTKTQAPVLAVARGLQKLAKAAEEAPNGAVGAAGGAMAGMAVGARFGGLPGAIAGMAIGGIGGGVAEKGANDFADKRNMVSRLKSDPDYTGKLLQEINDLEKPWYSGIPFIGNSTEIAKRRGAIRTADAKRGGEGDDDFKTAGLGGQGSYIGLSDLRQQTQIMGSGPEGALGLKNEMTELNQSLKALNNNFGQGNVVKPGNVAPPSN